MMGDLPRAVIALQMIGAHPAATDQTTGAAGLGQVVVQVVGGAPTRLQGGEGAVGKVPVIKHI